ncbi:protein phosphatase 1 regulatory subunit 3B [Festucalex cinctus]
MPTDMALPLLLPQEDFACRAAPTRRRRERANGKAEKRVTFADHRGLPLARVKLFSHLTDAIHVPAGARPAPDAAAAAAELVLDFAPPSSDYILFRQQVERNCVCLETCALKAGTLAGTVKVKNLSFEKRVRLRVTSDAWRSHSDVECAYVAAAYAGPGASGDTFAFGLALPQPLAPRCHVEFAVCYQVGGAEYWDSNHGHNYRVVRAEDKRQRDGEGSRLDSGVHLDAFGSLTCGRGILPEWASYAAYDNVGPYY